jgi:hypothetical protein
MPDGAVRVRATGDGDARRAGFAGLATCGSVWSCPVCAEKILAGRQHELADAIATWEAGGGRVALLTLTMRHKSGDRLADLWDGLSYAWGKVTSGRSWARVNERYGSADLASATLSRRIGWARVVETTHGANGWHVHVHCALFLPGDVTVDQVDDLAGSMFTTWAAALVRRGFLAPSDRHGVDVKLSGSPAANWGEYFAKSDYDVDSSRIALELARGDLKQARSGNRTPFRILSDFVEFGVADDLDLWSEWETASRGRRQLTWASGFRAVLLAESERSDDELAADELGSADDDLVEIPADGLRLVVAYGLHAELLDQAERDDTGKMLRVYLTARGIPFRLVARTRAPV